MKNNQPVTQKEVEYSESDVFVTRTDLKGVVTSANESFCRIAGFTEAELIGKSHNIVRHPDMPEWAFQDMWDTIKSGRPWRGIVKNRAKNGDHYWVRANVSPILRNGAVVGYLSLRKKPTRDEVRHAESLYQGDAPKKPAFSLSAAFNRWSLTTKFSVLTQPFLFLILSGGVSLLFSQSESSSSLLYKLLAWQAMIHVSLYALTGWILNRFVVRKVNDLCDHLNEVVDGDFRREVDISGRDEIGKMLCSMQSNKVLVGAVIDQVMSATKAIDAQSRTLIDAVKVARSVSAAQSSATLSMAAGMEEMSASIDQVAKNAEQVHISSVSAAENAASGGKSVVLVAADISVMEAEVSDAAKAVQALGAKSVEINDIVLVIKSIAEQTNLLALNAAIEAARAGEQGRGFAVVADEVRKLAEKTALSTNSVGQVVASIGQGTQEAIQMIEAAVAKAQRGELMANKAASDISNIENGSRLVLEGVADISHSIGEQSAASRDIASQIERIAVQAEQGGVSMATVNNSVVVLGNLSVSLKGLTDTFKV